MAANMSNYKRFLEAKQAQTKPEEEKEEKQKLSYFNQPTDRLTLTPQQARAVNTQMATMNLPRLQSWSNYVTNQYSPKTDAAQNLFNPAYNIDPAKRYAAQAEYDANPIGAAAAIASIRGDRNADLLRQADALANPTTAAKTGAPYEAKPVTTGDRDEAGTALQNIVIPTLKQQKAAKDYAVMSGQYTGVSDEELQLYQNKMKAAGNEARNTQTVTAAKAGNTEGDHIAKLMDITARAQAGGNDLTDDELRTVYDYMVDHAQGTQYEDGDREDVVSFAARQTEQSWKRGTPGAKDAYAQVMEEQRETESDAQASGQVADVYDSKSSAIGRELDKRERYAKVTDRIAALQGEDGYAEAPRYAAKTGIFGVRGTQDYIADPKSFGEEGDSLYEA